MACPGQLVIFLRSCSSPFQFLTHLLSWSKFLGRPDIQIQITLKEKRRLLSVAGMRTSQQKPLVRFLLALFFKNCLGSKLKTNRVRNTLTCPFQFINLLSKYEVAHRRGNGFSQRHKSDVTDHFKTMSLYFHLKFLGRMSCVQRGTILNSFPLFLFLICVSIPNITFFVTVVSSFNQFHHFYKYMSWWPHKDETWWASGPTQLLYLNKISYYTYQSKSTCLHS